MSESTAVDVPMAAEDGAAAILQTARALKGQLDDLLGVLQTATTGYEEMSARWEKLQQECRELRDAAQSLTRDRDESQEALGELRIAYDALLAEYETGQHALQQLSTEHEALRDEVKRAAEQLERLRSMFRA